MLIAPLACCIILLGIDISLFSRGLTWTVFHYESLLPLLSLNLYGSRGKGSSIPLLIVSGTGSTLYFVFHLTLPLLAGIRIFQIGAFAVALAWAYCTFSDNRNFKRLAVNYPFFLIFVSVCVIDKGLAHDKLASSYLIHFFGSIHKNQATISNNPVYRSARSDLNNGYGVVLITFESLGVTKDTNVFKELQKQFPDFSFLSIDYEGGSTVPGEIRYLCGLNGDLADNNSNCLPRKFESVAVHGNTLSYFDRYALYGDMGFNRLYGRGEMGNKRICDYAYNAVCDKDVLGLLNSEISKLSCRGFFYMLTIDSHFPYTKYNYDPSRIYEDLYMYLSFAQTLRREFPLCKVYIAGDHPPPMSTQFSNDKVLVVEPR